MRDDHLLSLEEHTDTQNGDKQRQFSRAINTDNAYCIVVLIYALFEDVLTRYRKSDPGVMKVFSPDGQGDHEDVSEAMEAA